MAKINTDLPEFIFQSSITALIDKINEQKEDSEITWNSFGGSVYASQKFIDYLNGREEKLTANVSGIAASMGAYILPFFDNVIGSEQSDVMIHPASGGEASTLDNTNKFLYDAMAKKVDEGKFEEITGRKLKDVVFGKNGNSDNVWITGKQAKQIGLYDETYNLLNSKVASLKGKLDIKELDYDLPENIKQKYGLKKETKINNNDMEIKDVTVDKLASGNVDVYNSMIGLGEKKNQERVKKVMKYAQYDLEKAAEIINDGRDLTLEDVEHFMEKKHNKKAVIDLENASEEEIKAAKTTKNKPELSEEEKEKKAAFDEEIQSMREDSGVNEILEKK